MTRLIAWTKNALEPATATFVSRKVAAVALVGAGISGLRFVPPADNIAVAVRVLCATVLTLGVLSLVWLFVFPPGGIQTGKPTVRRRR
jgi:hypothetical protein